MLVDNLFDFLTGKLPALEKTENGQVPLIYGTTENNGVAKFVEVDDEKDIFQPPLITVSYLGTAFVQVVPFTTSVVDKSNIIILKPKNKMSLEEMYFFAYQINRMAKFGFNYGRRMNMRQLKKLNLLPFENISIKVEFDKIIPKHSKKDHSLFDNIKVKFKEYPIIDLFKLVKGDFHALDKLDKGGIPTVSRTSFDNGIVGFFELPEDTKIYPVGCLTVSTLSGDTFIQLDDFMATDNVIICVPKQSILPTTLTFIQLMLNRQKWRYSYGRQCYKSTFEHTTVYLPTKDDGSLNEEVMRKIVENTTYWGHIKNKIQVKIQNMV